MTTPAALTAHGVGFRYGDQVVLEGVDLSGRPGSVVGLIGPNGSGKSTLLRCLAGLAPPSAGVVTLDGVDLAALRPRAVARQVGLVPQDAASAAGTSVAEFVLLGRHPHRREHQGFTAEDRDVAGRALARVDAVHLAARRLGELSGGERQRVAVARCVAQETAVLLLDEPTNHLDVRYQHEVLDLVRSLRLETVVVLHDLNLAARFCDHLVLLHEQRVAAEGPVGDVLEPRLLERVYGIAVRRLDLDGAVHLVFG